MVDAMNAMNYDAMVVGRMDLAIGLDALLARADEAQFAILSANIIRKSDQQLIFKPYTILDKDGVKVGIIGISEPDAIQAPGVPDVASVLDPQPQVRKYVEELRSQVDLLVVLSHLGIEADHALAQAVPGIDIIVGGNTRQLMREPDRIGNTLIVQQGYRGEWVGRLNATFVQGEPIDYTEELIVLNPDYADDADVKKLVDVYREKYPTPTPQPTWTPDPRTPTVDWEATSAAYATSQAENVTPQPTTK